MLGIIKKTLKKSFCSAVHYSGLYFLLSYIKKMRSNELAILMYHRISNGNETFNLSSNLISASKENFEKQLQYLAKHCNVMTFDDLYNAINKDGKLPKNSTIITFDDGYKDNFTVAYPILKKFDIPATIFLTTGFIDGIEFFWWDKVAYLIKNTKVEEVDIGSLGKISLRDKEESIRKIQERLKQVEESKKIYVIEKLKEKLMVKVPEAKGLFLSWQEVKEMSENNIYFGAHTVTHPILTKVSVEKAQSEVLGSRRKIEEVLNKKIKVFAYTNGTSDDMSEDIDDFLKKNGFIFSLSSIYGANKINSQSFRLKRIGVEADDDLLMFRIKLLGLGKIFAPLYLRFFK